MKNERAEKLIREKLGATDNIQGISFDGSTAWDTLEHRLERKPKKNKKVFYYWLAAAASLLFFVALVFENRAPETEIVREIKPVKIDEGAIKTPSIASVPAVNTNVRTKRVSHEHKSFEKHKVGSTAQIKPDVVAAFDINSSRAISETKKDTALIPKISPAIAAKPMMKEIHINELMDEPVEDPRANPLKATIFSAGHFAVNAKSMAIDGNTAERHFTKTRHFEEIERIGN